MHGQRRVFVKITDIFVKRPVLATCVNLLVLVAGLYATFNLTTRQYPKSDMAVVKVTTAYIGASAELVKGYVTTPLEKAIASADGIDYLQSSSKQGLSEISANLELNYDVNAALTQIQAKIAEVRNELPAEAESPVINVETTDSQTASMYLSFYSKDLQPNQITDYLLRVVQPKLSSVLGVQKADILGARTFAMRIWLDPKRMAALGVSPSEVKAKLAANNYLTALGQTKGAMVVVNMRANTDLVSVEDFEKLVIKAEDNALVRLSDVAKVELGAEDYDTEVRFGGQTATFMGIWVLPNANSLEVISAVRDVLPGIEANLPAGLSMSVAYDATKYIQDSIQEVIKTLTETVLIVIFVIFMFIGSFRSVLVPVVAIPLSLVGAMGLMLALGFTLNLLTLLAIVLAVGLVVDDAIVMLENAERHVEQGMKPMQAAIVGARELVGPIISMTITLAAVYAPIGIQGGLTGSLFREFAFTLAGAVAVSGFVALTLSPMMCSLLVRSSSESGAFKRRIERDIGTFQGYYRAIMLRVFSFRPFVLVVTTGVMLLVLPFYMFSAKELAPREDQGVVFSIVQAAPNSSLDQTTLFTKMVQDRFASLPGYEQSFQITWPTFGFSGMVTKPFSERDLTTQEIEGIAWGKMSEVPGIRTIVTTPAPLPGGSNFPVEFVISSTDEPERLKGYAEQLVQTAFQSGAFMYADMDLKIDTPQSEVYIDRDKTALMGLDLRSIGEDLSAFNGGNYVNRFSIQGRSYKVIPLGKRISRLNPEQLSGLYVRGPQDKLIPLSTIAEIRDSVIPRELKRFQQLNSVTIQGALIPGTSIDDGLGALEAKAAEILPTNYVVDYAGESRQLRTEGNTLLYTLGFAILLIYLVLAAQFESFRDPFIILAGSVPLALAGALAFPFFGLTSINIYSQVGLITLVGLVSKNGILIVEFANKLQEEGMSRVDAAIEAARVRLRPVLMTSVATVMGHFPLIIAVGAGAGARNSIGIVLVSGMVIGTFFTLFVVPVLYSVMASTKRRDESSDPVGDSENSEKQNNSLSAVKYAQS